MTRPGGVTPRGLPYPGSANIHSETPKALQALATAVQDQLGSIAGGISLRFFVGTKALDSSASATLSFPGFTIYGGMVQLASHLGGNTSKVGYATGVAAGGKFTMMSVNNSLKSMGPETFNGDTVGICAVVWGTG